MKPSARMMVPMMTSPCLTRALLACSLMVHEHRHHPEVNHHRHLPSCLQGRSALSFLDPHLRFLAQALLSDLALCLRYHLVTPTTTTGMVSWWRQHLLLLFMADQLLFCLKIWPLLFSAKSYSSEDGHRRGCVLLCAVMDGKWWYDFSVMIRLNV